MSLTSHLDDRTSPVRQLFAARYPHLHRLRFAEAEPTGATVRVKGRNLPLSEVARFAPGTARVLPGSETGYPWGTAGTAFDYRLRYLYAATPPESLVAAAGASLLADELRLPGLPQAWRELAEALPSSARPAVPDPSDADELALGRLCVVLAYFEQLYRVGVGTPGWEHNPVVTGAGLADLLRRVDPRLPVDVAALTRLWPVACPELAQPGRLVLNPTFACSADLGGADADLIVDGLLMEVKTSKHARLNRGVWWQLLGYLLADTDDAHEVTAVGVYYARYGYLWAFTAHDFLERLAGGPVDLSAARREFAQVARDARLARYI